MNLQQETQLYAQQQVEQRVQQIVAVAQQQGVDLNAMQL